MRRPRATGGTLHGGLGGPQEAQPRSKPAGGTAAADKTETAAAPNCIQLKNMPTSARVALLQLRQRLAEEALDVQASSVLAPAVAEGVASLVPHRHQGR